jgi:hypothetical protein
MQLFDNLHQLLKKKPPPKQALPARTNPFSVFQRSPFAFSFGHRSTPTTFPSSTDRLTPSVPFPVNMSLVVFICIAYLIFFI